MLEFSIFRLQYWFTFSNCAWLGCNGITRVACFRYDSFRQWFFSISFVRLYFKVPGWCNIQAVTYVLEKLWLIGVFKGHFFHQNFCKYTDIFAFFTQLVLTNASHKKLLETSQPTSTVCIGFVAASLCFEWLLNVWIPRSEYLSLPSRLAHSAM